MRGLTFLLAGVLLAVPCRGRLIIVDDDGLADFNNIQAAIDDSNDGDTIYVFPGTYTGAGNYEIDFGGRAITVSGTDPNDPDVVDATIIDANGDGVVVYFDPGCGPNSVLAGLTITGGYGRLGGGITCTEGSCPTINGCSIMGNFANYGGGVWCWFSGLTISNCRIMGNYADDWGGGMFNSHSVPMVTNCTFSGNSAEEVGGGVFNGSSSPTVTKCTFSGNWANRRGGGMFNNESDPTVANCTFTGNSTNRDGGGMFNTYWSNPTLSNCAFVGNSATNGTAIACDSFLDPSTVEVTNCILWGSGDQIWNNDGSTITLTYSDIQDGWVGPGANNMNVDPCFVDPGYWDDPCNTPGDPNDDVWFDGDYHLQSEIGRWDANSQMWVIDANHSLCIDAGDPNDPNWTEELWPHGKLINIGAYGGTPEASMSLSSVGNTADLDHDGDVDYVDLDFFTDEWTSELFLLAEDLDRNGLVNFPDYCIFADNWAWEE